MTRNPKESERELLRLLPAPEELHGPVRAACLRELRARATAETTLLDAIVREPAGPLTHDEFLESVRDTCRDALQDPAPRWGIWLARAAAIAGLLAVAGNLVHRSPEPAAPVATIETPPAPTPPPSYLVHSRPLPGDVLVRTSRDVSSVVYIDDDGLMASVPGLAIARTWDHQGNATIFIAGPAREGPSRFN